MARLAEIRAHIEGMSALLDIVGAMRSLAGMRLQEAQQVLPGIRSYAEILAAGLADTLVLLGQSAPAPGTQSGGGRSGAGLALVLCTSENGFVGGFNEHLVEAVEKADEPGRQLFVLGTRGAMLAEERGLKPDWVHPMATRSRAAAGSVEALTAVLYSGIAAGRIGRVEVVFARYAHGITAAVERRQVLPLDPESFRAAAPHQPPLHALPPQDLYEKLLEEYVFSQLTEALVESIASENAARLAAMESAKDNVGRKLEQLRGSERQVRQEEITTELLDVVAGAEAVEGD